MAVLFNQEKFIKSLLRKAEELDIYDEVSYELDAFKKRDLIEYLFIVSKFVKSLDKNDIPTVLRRTGGSSYIAYLLGINRINPKEYDLTNYLFVNQDEIRFDICVPKQYIQHAIKLLGDINYHKTKHSIYVLKDSNYKVGIFAHPALERIVNLEKETGLKYKDIPLMDKDVLNFMFEEYQSGYYMPNLKGCYVNVLYSFYQAMKVSQVKSLIDFAKLQALFNGCYYSETSVIDHLKMCGFEFTIFGKEQLFSLLTNIYEINECDAYAITENVSHGNLAGWEELILRSREVPDYIFEQFENIRYLHYSAYGVQSAYLSYLLAYYKYHYKDIFNNLLPKLPFQTNVGPFFYINGQFYYHLEPLSSFSPNLHFFDSGISHFDLFNKLNIDGDYGNYSRGRVIYDNYKHQVIIYIDKSLNKKEIKEQLKNIYQYDNHILKTVYKYDSHYCHDNL